MRALLLATATALAVFSTPAIADVGGSSISRRSREYAEIRNQPRVVINNNYYGGPAPGYAAPQTYVIYENPYPDYYYYVPYPDNVPTRRRLHTAPVQPSERYNILDKTGEVKVWSRAPR